MQPRPLVQSRLNLMCSKNIATLPSWTLFRVSISTQMKWHPHIGIAPHNVIIRQQVPPGALSGKLIAGKFTESSTIEYRPLGCTCRDWKSRGSIEMRALSESGTQ